MTSQVPEWGVVDEGANQRVRLTGQWLLFTRTHDRKRLIREFRHLSQPAEWAWDLTEVAGFDSAAALLLWRLWGRRWPADLHCPKKYRHWFRRFEALPEPPPAPHHGIVHGLAVFGAGLFSFFQTTFGLGRLVGRVFVDFGHCIVRPRLFPGLEISAQVYRIGVSSMLLLGVTGFMIGVVMTIQLGISLKSFGATHRIIGLLGLAVLRELGPVIAALIQAGRSGSSITAGVGGMHLTEEIAALETFGSSPTLRLVLPPVVAMLIVMPLLTVWTDFTEIVGGMVAAQLHMGVPHLVFISQFPEKVSLFNFWFGLGKAGLFGFFIAVVGAYFGLTAGANTDSLTRQTTKSVVVSLTAILILDAVLGALFAGIGMNK